MKNQILCISVLIVFLIATPIQNFAQTQTSRLFSLLGTNIQNEDYPELLGPNYKKGSDFKHFQSTDYGMEIKFAYSKDKSLSTDDLIASRHLNYILVSERYFDQFIYKDNMPFGIKRKLTFKACNKLLKSRNDISLLNMDKDTYKITFLYTGQSPFKNKTGVIVTLEFGREEILRMILSEPI